MSRSPVADTLQGSTVHDGWIDRYRQPDNEPFYQWAFDLVTKQLPNGLILDAGCGSGTKTAHLVSRGFRVIGVDVSERMVQQARAAIPGATFGTGDLTALTYASGHFDGVVCWGVLMHVPDIAAAIKELARVTKPGGIIVLSENSERSLHWKAIIALRKLRPRARDVRQVPSGTENWEATPDGPLVTRYVNPSWLIAELQKHGCELVDHRAGEFSQAYAVTSNPLARRIVHAVNRVWYRWIRSPRLAQGQLLIFRKRG